MRNLRINPELVIQAPTTEGHKNYGLDCRLAQSPALARILSSAYEREGLCLKLFKDSQGKTAKTYRWGGVTLFDATQVQNILSWYGLAPRVIDVVTVNDGALAQVCEYADGTGKPDPKKAQEVLRKYRIGAKGEGSDVKRAAKYVGLEFKWVGGWFVDFGRFYLTNKEWYKGKLQRAVQHRRRGPGNSLVGYQDVVEMSIPGQRNHEHRLRHMRLQDLSLKGATVLDLGCNNGTMLREALRRGAARVVGVDYTRCGLWRQINNWLGYWNVDIVDASLPNERAKIEQETGIKQFDVVFAFAILQHMKGEYGSWIADLTKGVLVLEGDVKLPEEYYRPALARDFEQVELTGYIKDEDRRCLFRCYKSPPKAPRRRPTTRAALKRWAVEQSQSIYGQVMLYEKEAAWLYDRAKDAPDGAAIEIGTLCASGTVAWATACAGQGPQYTIDAISRPEAAYNLNRLGFEVTALIGPSATVSIEPWPAGDIAFLFIDGDHSYKGVCADMKRFLPEVKAGGIVVFDDYVAPERKGYGVKQAIDEWSEASTDWQCIGTKDRMIAFKKR